MYEPVGGADEASIEVSSAEDGAVLREGWFRAVTQRSWSSAMMHVQSDADSQTHSEPLWLEVKETGTLTVYSDRMKRGPHDPGSRPQSSSRPRGRCSPRRCRASSSCEDADEMMREQAAHKDPGP